MNPQSPGDTIHVHVEYFDGSDKEDEGVARYIASCDEISVITDAATFDELLTNIREAVALHLSNEDTVSAYNLLPNPRIVLMMDLEDAPVTTLKR
jgi:predicted RNase H-like HicB family nuclease